MFMPALIQTAFFIKLPLLNAKLSSPNAHRNPGHGLSVGSSISCVHADEGVNVNEGEHLTERRSGSVVCDRSLPIGMPIGISCWLDIASSRPSEDSTRPLDIAITRADR